MSHISKKILIDLEFPSVIERIVAQAQTSLGKELAHKIKPFKGQFSAEQELFKTDEILKSSLVADSFILRIRLSCAP